MTAPYHRALLRAVTMAEVSHRMKFYELTAVCARRVAEMYVELVLAPQEYWSLGEGLSLLPEMPEPLWAALKKAQHIGNRGAHAQEDRMEIEDGDDALSAAMTIAQAYLSQIHARRARL